MAVTPCGGTCVTQWGVRPRILHRPPQAVAFFDNNKVLTPQFGEPGAEQKFKDISNAYEVLSDDEKRSLYDNTDKQALKVLEWAWG
ncbi:hypothetical protein QJS10_CPB19g00672 [Acorus calamus]|uniref:J domain-containing protein n=1 Tax=Acorus calamus TaxID=4465 RepID=A0AAV9CIA8_ACOCL|nr:hypothetical protein QJS10_CPB19g00672 [Acorus calamus]